MNPAALERLSLLAATEASGTRMTWEFGRESWQGLAILAVVVFLLIGWLYRRDTREIHWFWKGFLFSLRAAVLAGVLVIALNPQMRTETEQVRPSRVVVLVDGSVSMGFPESATAPPTTPMTPAPPATATPSESRSRAVAIQDLITQTPLLAELRKTHDLVFYRFDSRLEQLQVLPRNIPESATSVPATASASPPTPLNAQALVEPRGLETRLGESLAELIRETAGETLAGIVIVSDGQSNAGLDVDAAREAALAAKVRLITVGVGSTAPPVNLQLANVQAPTMVRKGDSFTITAFVQGQGVTGQAVEVQLQSKLENDPAPASLIEKKTATLVEAGVPVAVSFEYIPVEPGRRIFNLKVVPVTPIAELTLADNEKPLPPVEITERKTRVLAIAGGPMREYQFVRNVLFRDPGIEIDLWLQTARAGVSQEAREILDAFPTEEAKLFEYDVIIAFDPQWSLVPPAGRDALVKWVNQHAGGLILVAGDVFLPELARMGEEGAGLKALYPVSLRPNVLDLELRSDESQQAWPVAFTPDGTNAEFLQMVDVASTSADLWKQFPGVYRCYSSAGAKAGATVYAHFSDRRAETEQGQPVLLAGQFYGSGRVLYLGSPELWRLRALEEQYYERLWIKILREVGQGRLLRGTNRGVLLLERQTYPLGTTMAIRASLLDQTYQNLLVPQVNLEVVDPQGKRMVPPLVLAADKTRPGQYQGQLTGYLPGRYRLELPIPESTDQVVSYLQVEIPNLEFEQPQQNAPLLQRLATTENGGQYLPLSSAVEELPKLLPDRSTTRIQFDVPRELWDRDWVMYLLVGLLALEWTVRKILRLA